jgi:hypothetical protein
MLGNHRLANTQDGFDVTNTGFPMPKDQDDLDTDWLAEQAEDIWRGYIRLHEYIISNFPCQSTVPQPKRNRYFHEVRNLL